MKEILTLVITLLYCSVQGKQVGPAPSETFAHTKATMHPPATIYSYREQQRLEVAQEQDDATKNKTLSKSFSVDRNDKVSLTNTFGSTTVQTWAKNEVKIDADIRAYAKDADEAQKMIDDLIITINKEGDQVTFKSTLQNKGSNWGRGSKNGRSWRREIKVYLKVYMPKNLALKATQQYGNLQVPDLTGSTSLKVQYGNLTAGSLENTNNYINVQYGKATLQKVSEGRINVQYGSGLSISSANDLELEAQYTSVRLGTVRNNLQAKVQYGSGLSANYLGSLNLTLQYAGLNVKELAGNFTGKVQYGRLNIGQVNGTCKVFNADLDYTPANLTFSANYGADLNVNTHYAGFSYSDRFNVKKAGDEKSSSISKQYKGTVGNGGGNLQINSNYGSITIK